MFKLGNYEDAINAYGESLKLNSDDLDAWLKTGHLHMLVGNSKEAIDCYDHVLTIDSNHAKAWYLKGQALLSMGGSDAAYCFDKAKDLGFSSESANR